MRLLFGNFEFLLLVIGYDLFVGLEELNLVSSAMQLMGGITEHVNHLSDARVKPHINWQTRIGQFYLPNQSGPSN